MRIWLLSTPESRTPKLEGLGSAFPPRPQGAVPSTKSIGKNIRRRRRLSIPLQAGQALWRSRYGELTSIRFSPSTAENSAVTKTELHNNFEDALIPSGWHRSPEHPFAKSRCRAPRDKFWRILRLLQFLPGCLSTPSSRVVFQAQCGAEDTGNRPASWAGHGAFYGSKDLLKRRPLAVVRRSRPWVWRRDTVRRSHHRGVTHLVDRSDRHREYHAPSVLPFCCCWRHWRCSGRASLYCPDTSRPEAIALSAPCSTGNL